jgi:hypothetical protein
MEAKISVKSPKNKPNSGLRAKKVIWLARQMEKREKKSMKVGGEKTSEKFITHFN